MRVPEVALKERHVEYLHDMLVKAKRDHGLYVDKYTEKLHGGARASGSVRKKLERGKDQLKTCDEILAIMEHQKEVINS